MTACKLPRKGGFDMGDETRVQMMEVKKGAAAMGNVVERYLIRFLGPVGRKIAAANKTGRTIALIGVVAAILSIVLGLTSGTVQYGVGHWKKGLKYVYVSYETTRFVVLVIGYAMYKIGLTMKK